MKPTAFLSFLFFLLFAFTATAVLAEVVIDSDGDIMRNGGTYYLSSAAPIGGGGILPDTIINQGDPKTCSIAVVSKLNTEGWEVTISSPIRAGFISTTFPLNISFPRLGRNVCTGDSRDWVVKNSLPVGQPVMIGSAEEFGSAYVPGWFFIKTHDSEKHYYKLVFCEHGNDHCGDIGVKVDGEERRRLVVTDKDPLVFKFDKVNESFASDLSMVV
ncbi:trypsin inhibitor A-like [Prosopis cineraria]|uniref:trypsin inhibitor A-like n=1 Tax=Prosopis cineraria TaxID=364024 RepID=UPI0024107265|nr:trypsin inhibitor A-like [Prosopis cineraria]XP_054785959.1 trypsin inhibitor A-like [Prosopis cineraria]